VSQPPPHHLLQLTFRYISRRQLPFFSIHSRSPLDALIRGAGSLALIMARVLGTCSPSRRLQINSCWKLLSCTQHPLEKYINAPKEWRGGLAQIQLQSSRVSRKFFARKKRGDVWLCGVGLFWERTKSDYSILVSEIHVIKVSQPT
jgi:hypothetical protein